MHHGIRKQKEKKNGKDEAEDELDEEENKYRGVHKMHFIIHDAI